MIITTMKQALEALSDFDYDKRMAAITALRQAIEAEMQVLVGHADLAINNIYVFNDQEERVVPEGRQGIYLCLQTPKHD